MLMEQYAKRGNMAEASVHFEQAAAEANKALADTRRAVMQSQIVSKSLDIETANLLHFKARLYVDYGVLTQNEAYVATGLEAATKVVSFCENAFGVGSDQAVVAKRNERRLVDKSKLVGPSGGRAR